MKLVFVSLISIFLIASCTPAKHVKKSDNYKNEKSASKIDADSKNDNPYGVPDKLWEDLKKENEQYQKDQKQGEMKRDATNALLILLDMMNL